MERRASGLRGAVAVAFLGVLVIAALVSPVGAALNKNKVKNIATKTVKNLTYTEAEADARFINTGDKASDSELLDGVDSGGFIQPQGLALVSTGHKGWVIQGSSGITASHASNTTQFTSSGAVADQFIGVSPNVPIAMFGRSLQLEGVEFCYSVGAATLDAFFLFVHNNTSDGIPQPSDEVVKLEDDTDRTSSACRLYTLPTPVTLSGEYLVGITARVDYSSATSFSVGRTTLLLRMTTTPVQALARRGDAVTLSPAQSDTGVKEA